MGQLYLQAERKSKNCAKFISLDYYLSIKNYI